MKTNAADHVDTSRARLQAIHEHVQGMNGFYTRVGRKLGLDRSFVSRVARGERKSRRVEAELITEFEQLLRAVTRNARTASPEADNPLPTRSDVPPTRISP